MSETSQESQFFGPPTLKLIVDSAWALTVSRKVNYAAFTVMIWDLILTFPREVSLIWSSRVTLVKILFLFNRYASPLVMGVNVWMMSGLATGLTTPVCRGWFSVAFLIQLLCTTFVSILISFRLWAWYGMSSRSLYILSMAWILSFSAAFGLVVYSAWAKNYLLHEVYFNICTSVAPTIWTQWLPGTLEHGFYFCFLVVGAMSTPRSAQTPALAVLYRDGIIFYLVTFSVMLTSLLVWGLASRLWLGLTLYAPWIVFQISISRLLLDVKTSELFRRRREENSSNGMVRSISPLREFALSRPMESTHGQREKHAQSPPLSYSMSNVSRPSFHNQDHDEEHHRSDRASTVRLRNRRRDRKFWWIFGRNGSISRDIHVDVLADDQWGGAIGGVKDSRLGRFDSWMW